MRQHLYVLRHRARRALQAARCAHLGHRPHLVERHRAWVAGPAAQTTRAAASDRVVSCAVCGARVGD